MLKQALKNKQSLLGTFIKTPHYNVIEVLAHASMDVLCLDAEHAPFSRQDLDTCILAARAGNMPVLVRTPNDAPETLLNVLDMGADGVVVPHVKTAEQL
ncbi:aldolase, partial [Pseudomonas sp. HMWF031]